MIGERSKHAVDHARQLFLAPAQEKLGGHVGIDAPRQPLDVLGAQHGIADERTGHQRRQREQMQDVVAVVGDELRALVAHLDDVAELVRHARDDLERLAVHHDLGRRRVGDRDARAVRRGAQQLQVQVELPQQRALGQRAARRREQRGRQQVDGRDRGRGVDAAHDAHRELADQRVHRRQARVVLEALLAPARQLRIEQVVEADRLAHVHVHGAEALAQHPQATSAGPSQLSFFFGAPDNSEM